MDRFFLDRRSFCERFGEGLAVLAAAWSEALLKRFDG
jgi:hypothetical protein